MQQKKLYITRYLEDDIQRLALDFEKMAFIAGPRQVGKTTLAKHLGSSASLYLNWDDKEFRKKWTRDPKSILLPKIKTIILDELHKSKGWKTSLKGFYDTLTEKINILVTGSARLNIYKKGGDSMLGRYIMFRVHPFSVGELTEVISLKTPENFVKMIFDEKRQESRYSVEVSEEVFDNLLQFGGFPESYFRGDSNYTQVWQNSRLESLVREDLRDLTRITELSQIEMLIALLSNKVGSSLNIESLREDLEVAHKTVKSWLKHLEEIYYFYEVKPYSKSIPRSLKREGKFFLWDWSEAESGGARYENLVASHLLKACHYWTDTGKGKFELFYLRNKEKVEVDFLICNKGKPWMTFECKSSSTQLETSFLKFSKYTGVKHHVQIVRRKDFYEKLEKDGVSCVVMSASQFLSFLP